MVRGGCLCGRFRFEADGPFQHMMSCHCTRCRKHHGAAFATFVGSPASGFRWLAGEGEARSFPTGSGQRSFCPDCGSKVPGGEWNGLVFYPAGLLDDDPGVRPEMNVFVKDKAAWSDLDEGAQSYEGMPPGFQDPGIPTPPRPAGAAPDSVAGSCLCGAVAYELIGTPTRMGNCYCSRCRKARSAAFSTLTFVPRDKLRWLAGHDKVVDFALPGTRFFGNAFCGDCGSPVPRDQDGAPMVWVPAGSLDDDPGMRPQADIYVGSKAAWVEVQGDRPRFDDAPPTR